MIASPRMHRLALRVPGSDEGLRLAAQAFDRFCAEHGVPAGPAWKLHVVLDELLSNVVRHAYAGRAAGEIDVELDFVPASISATVIDDGPPFDPLLQPEPRTEAPLEERTAGGLGIALVRSLTDTVRYERREGRNALTVTCRTDVT